MKALLLSIFLFVLTAPLNAQRSRPPQDAYPTECGPMKVQPVTHAFIVLMHKDEVVYIDPVGGPRRFEGLPDPTLVILTDIHSDHTNRRALRHLPLNDVPLVMPRAVEGMLPMAVANNTRVTLNNGEDVQVNGVGIEAIPMYNLPVKENALHPPGRGNGYVLTFCGTRIYISGDSEDIPEMRALEDIDVAFVTMNLPFTMDVEHAADAVLEFQPDVVYPYHYKGLNGLSDIEAFQSLVNEKNKDITVILRDWYQ